MFDKLSREARFGCPEQFNPCSNVYKPCIPFLSCHTSHSNHTPSTLTTHMSISSNSKTTTHSTYHAAFATTCPFAAGASPLLLPPLELPNSLCSMRLAAFAAGSSTSL